MDFIKTGLSFCCAAFFLASANGSSCSYFTTTSSFLSQSATYAKYYTPDTDSCADADPIGTGCIVFPASEQGQSTEIRERPRNGGCTYYPYVYDTNGNTVEFHDNPYCDDDYYGHWDYKVPTVSEISDKNYSGSVHEYTTDSDGNPYVVLGWAALMKDAHKDCGDLDCYTPSVTYGIYPEDTTGQTVYISSLCV